MQKKLIALAIAGLSSAAFAQSNVTVYGVVDTSWESVKAEGATAAAATTDLKSRGRLSANSSYIGFKGSEALGNGLTAVFQIETGVNSDAAPTNAIAGAAQVTGGGQVFGGIRDTFIGVAGSFGTVAAGTLTHPMRAYGAKVDNNPGASSIGFTGSMYGQMSYNGGAAVKAGTDERASNAIAYISPTFGGFSATFAYVNGENRPVNETTNTPANSAVNSKAWQLAAQYDNGPLFVGYAHHDAEDPVVLGLTQDSTFEADRIAAVYTIGGATKLSALWDKQKADLKGTGTVERKAWMLGASHTFGANQVYLQLAKARNATGTAVTAGLDTSAKQTTLGYVYNLSKRTNVHAYYSKITNAANGTYDFYVNASGIGAGTDGADPTGYGVGLRHSF